jgi:LysM repeat protein
VPPQRASITITSPQNGQVVNVDRGLTVTGVAVGVPENNVVVQVIGSTGAVLAQTPTTADANGNWAITLNIGQAQGNGQILAFAPSPADGSWLASASVSVTFTSTIIVPPTPVPPLPTSITIVNPRNGGTANATSGFITVSGTAVNIFENNVIVQVRDAFNRTMQQSATTADPNGNWTVSIGYLVENGTSGSIRAYSQSPADGSVSAESIINVVFASNCVVNTNWPVYTVKSGDTLLNIAINTGSTVAELTTANCLPNPSLIFTGQQIHVPRLPAPVPPNVEVALAITSPTENLNIIPGGPFIVSGSTTGTAEGNTFVRLIDVSGTVFAEELATVTTQTQNGQWQWQADLDTTNMLPGRRLTVYAYAINPVTGGVLVADTVNVTYGPVAANEPFITITSPLPYSQLTDRAGITVTGRAGNLVDVITVQALDDNSQILAEVTTNNPQSADGEWAVTLPLPETRRGRIVAISGDQTTQSVLAYAVLDVIFGDPTQNSSFVLITFPLPGTVISNAEPYVIVAGMAQGIFTDRLSVNVLDENNNIVLSAPAQFNASTGQWSISSTANQAIQNQRNLKIQVIATTPQGGVLAADSITITTLPEVGTPPPTG